MSSFCHDDKQSTKKSGAYVPPHRRREAAAASSSRDGSNNKNKQSSQDDMEILCAAFSRICCINLEKRRDKWRAFENQARCVGELFREKVERVEAVDGSKLDGTPLDVTLEWDATKNAQYSSRVTAGSQKVMTPGEVGCAMSHIQLWKELVAQADTRPMLILEDDAVFTSKRGKSRFARAFCKIWKQVPQDWAVLYLGFSGRGERLYVDTIVPLLCQQSRRSDPWDPDVQLYAPTYGFHTHAYVIAKAGASRLLENLPVTGPIDVWLADNEWFGLPVYCAVIANEGWKLDDGTYEGANLVDQQRKGTKSDIAQSSQSGR